MRYLALFLFSWLLQPLANGHYILVVGADGISVIRQWYLFEPDVDKTLLAISSIPTLDAETGDNWDMVSFPINFSPKQTTSSSTRDTELITTLNSSATIQLVGNAHSGPNHFLLGGVASLTQVETTTTKKNRSWPFRSKESVNADTKKFHGPFITVMPNHRGRIWKPGADVSLQVPRFYFINKGWGSIDHLIPLGFSDGPNFPDRILAVGTERGRYFLVQINVGDLNEVGTPNLRLDPNFTAPSIAQDEDGVIFIDEQRGYDEQRNFALITDVRINAEKLHVLGTIDVPGKKNNSILGFVHSYQIHSEGQIEPLEVKQQPLGTEAHGRYGFHLLMPGDSDTELIRSYITREIDAVFEKGALGSWKPWFKLSEIEGAAGKKMVLHTVQLGPDRKHLYFLVIGEDNDNENPLVVKMPIDGEPAKDAEILTPFPPQIFYGSTQVNCGQLLDKVDVFPSYKQ